MILKKVSKGFLSVLFTGLLFSPLVHAQTGGQSSLNFNGSSDDCTIRNDATLNPKDEITVEAWIKPESFGTNIYDNSIFCKHGWGSGNAGYVLRCGASGGVSFNVASSGGNWQEADSKSGLMATGKWYHVAGTFDGDTVTVYLNGVVVATKLYSGSLNPSSIDAKIGEIAYGKGGRNFDGDIDEVKVWTKAVKQDTIKAWMCRKTTSKHPNHSALSGYWKLDENTGNTIKDATVNGNDGKLSGPLWSVSGAALGDEAIYSYSGATKLSMKGADGDVFTIHSIAGKHESVHLYQMLGKSPLDSLTQGSAVLDTTHQWGVFFGSPSSSSYDVNFEYSSFKQVTSSNECYIDIFKRSNLANRKWQAGKGSLVLSGDSIVLQSEKGGEYIFGLYGTDRTLTTETGDSSFCANESLKLIAPGTASFRYQWYRNGTKLTNDTLGSLTVTKAGKYKADVFRSTKCSYVSNEMNVTTLSIPTVSLSAQTGICESVDSLYLTGGIPRGGAYLAKGVKADSIFYPAIVKDGSYDIVYKYFGSNGCYNADTQKLEVFDLPKVKTKSIIGACNDKDTIHMMGATPVGGTFTGKGITNNVFYLDSVNRKLAKYSYVYDYTDANGCSNTSNGSVEVLFATPITFKDIDTSCSNDPAFRIKVNPNQGTYLGKGVVGRDFNPTLAGIGSHEIIFEFKNLNGCITSASQTAVVLGFIPALYASSDSICVNSDSIILQGGSPSGGVYNGTGLTNGSFFPDGLLSGLYDVDYVYTDVNGCADTAMGQIKVLDTTALSVRAIAALCIGADELVLENVSPKGGSYSGNGVSSDKFKAFDAGSGIHAISYVFNNASGCSNEASFNIEVYEAKDVQITMPDEVCNNSEPIVISNVKPKGGVISGPGVSSGSFDAASLSPGSYYIAYAHVDDLSCEVKDSTEVIVLESPKSSLSQQQSLCVNSEEVKLSGGLPAGGIYYVDELEQETFDPSLGSGQYSLTYAVGNANGCRDSSDREFWVNEAPAIPTIGTDGTELVSSADEGNQWYDKDGEINSATNKTLTPGRDGTFTVAVMNDSGCVATSEPFLFTSMEDFVSSSFQIFPNPAKDYLIIRSLDKEVVETVQIVAVNGEVVLTARFDNMNTILDISILDAGFYTTRIGLESGLYVNKTFIVTD